MSQIFKILYSTSFEATHVTHHAYLQDIFFYLHEYFLCRNNTLVFKNDCLEFLTAETSPWRLKILALNFYLCEYKSSQMPQATKPSLTPYLNIRILAVEHVMFALPN